MTGSDTRRLATYDHDEDQIFVAVASCGWICAHAVPEWR